MKLITLMYDPKELPEVDGEPMDLFDYLMTEFDTAKIRVRMYEADLTSKVSE